MGVQEKFRDGDLHGLNLETLLALDSANLLQKPKISGRRSRRRMIKEQASKSTVAVSLLAAQGCMISAGEKDLQLNAGATSADLTKNSESQPKTSSKKIVANDDTGFTTTAGEAIEISTQEILINDVQNGKDGATVSEVFGAINGTVELNGSVITFTPADGFEGPASFEYTISDKNGKTSTAKVEIDIIPDGHDGQQGGSTETDGGSQGDDGTDDTPHDTDDNDDHDGGDEGHNNDTPHPDDPDKHMEHMAALKLVPVADASHIAVKSGSWFDPTTWANGEIPSDGASVVIPHGLTVEYDAESQASIFTVRVDGGLEFATDKDTHLEVDTMVVTTVGTLRIGTDQSPVEAGVDAVISFANNGAIDASWDPLLLSRGLIGHGRIEIHGAEKENFVQVATDPMAGDTSLLLSENAAGWEVGDRLVLTGTKLSESATEDGKRYAQDAVRTDTTQDEELVITRIEGDRIFFDSPLEFDHDTPRGDLKAYVANYSRNVRFESENADGLSVHERGHVMFMHNDDIDVRYAEFFELGRTDKSERAFDTDDLDMVHSDSNVKGRYSLHIHRAGVSDLDDPAMLVGNAVWGSPGWGFVHHDSNAILAGNAAYDVFGAAFVAESGNETGRWVDNIAIKSIGVQTGTKDSEDLAAFDLGRNGVGFWHQGRSVESVDNVAAGMPGGVGFAYFHRTIAGEVYIVDPNTTHFSDALRYQDEASISFPNISLFANNQSIATRIGLEIIKAGPQQGSDLRSVIDGFSAWEVHTGIALEYTGHYTILDTDLIGSQENVRSIDTSTGVKIGNNTFDLVFNRASIDGFDVGVYASKETVNHVGDRVGDDDFNYVFIDVDINGASVDYTNITASDQFLTQADLVEGRLLFTPDYEGKFASGDVNDPQLELQGTKVDSIGQVETSTAWDPFYLNTRGLRGALEENGYWHTDDGRMVTLIEEYVSDRATGDIVKVGVFVEFDDDRLLIPGRFVRTEPEFHGILDDQSQAPIAVTDRVTVSTGEAITIDVLGNDRDPDGDEISLDGLWSNEGRVIENDDGTVTFFSDPGSSGDFSFNYWVEDSNGNFTMGETIVTVEI